MHFGIGKSRDETYRGVSHLSDSAAQHIRNDERNTLVMTGVTRTIRVEGPRHGVDWGGHVNLTISSSCS